MSDLAKEVERRVSASVARYDAELGESGVDTRAEMILRLRGYHKARLIQHRLVEIARWSGAIAITCAAFAAFPLWQQSRFSSLRPHLGRAVLHYSLSLALLLLSVGLVAVALEQLSDRYFRATPLPPLSNFVVLILAALATLSLGHALGPSWWTATWGAVLGLTTLTLIARVFVAFVIGPFHYFGYRFLLRPHSEMVVVDNLLQAIEALRDRADHSHLSGSSPHSPPDHRCVVRARTGKGLRGSGFVAVYRNFLSITIEGMPGLLVTIAPAFYSGPERSNGGILARAVVKRTLFGDSITLTSWNNDEISTVELRPKASNRDFWRLQDIVYQLSYKTYQYPVPRGTWSALSWRRQIIDLLDGVEVALKDLGPSLKLDEQTALFFAEQKARRAEAVRRWKEAALTPRADTPDWLLVRMRHCVRAAGTGSWDLFDSEAVRPRTKREWLQTARRYLVAGVVAAAPFAVLFFVRQWDPAVLKEGYFFSATIIWALGITITTLDPTVLERMKGLGDVFPFPGSKKKEDRS
jgi:hypothetical protein